MPTLIVLLSPPPATPAEEEARRHSALVNLLILAGLLWLLWRLISVPSPAHP